MSESMSRNFNPLATLRRSLSLICLLLPSLTFASQLPQVSAVPGGVAQIVVGDAQLSAPQAFYNDKRVLITSHDGRWLALVGIPLVAAPGSHALRIAQAGMERTIAFDVAGKTYPEQRLTIKNKRLVDEMTPEDLKRIDAEKAEMAVIKTTWTDQPVDIDFKPPVDGRLSSLFGLKRFFNNVPRQPHNGLDIAAPVGTAIKAPAPGTVRGVGNYFFNGNTVFLDHGQGLLSVYVHMNKIDVQIGQAVKRGDKLGEVGATGRATGPHLHWIVYLNQEAVDPALFIADAPLLQKSGD